MKFFLVFFLYALILAGCIDQTDDDWRNYGGNLAGNRYSALEDINIQNVKNLKIAWTYDKA